MQYGLGVWGSMTSKSQINEIYTLQKQCIRLLSKDKATPKDHLFKRHTIIRFPDMIQIELCKLGFKLAKKNLPELLQVLMESRGGKKFHMNNTQNMYPTFINITASTITLASCAEVLWNTQNYQKILQPNPIYDHLQGILKSK